MAISLTLARGVETDEFLINLGADLDDDDCYMYVLQDRASAEAWWEMPDGYACGFDALARPLRMTGEPHQVTLELSGDEPAEADLRRLVAGHY